MTMAYTALLNQQAPDGSWTIPPNEIALRRARRFRVLWVPSSVAAQPPTVADGYQAANDTVLGEGGAPGGPGVLPRTMLSNVQNPDGSWLLGPSDIATARLYGYVVYWTTDASAETAPTETDGLVDNDVVNGGRWLAETPPEPILVTIQPSEYPIADDQPDTANDTVVITKVTGVVWVVAGIDYPSSAIVGATQSIPTGGSLSVNVEANPDTGYELTNVTRSWTLPFTDEPAGSAAYFYDDFGSSALDEATFLARATPEGGATVAKAGTGAVSVNALGYLVMDGASGPVAVDYTLPGKTGKPGKLEVLVESNFGSVGVDLVLAKTAATGTQARVTFRQSSQGYEAQVMISSSAGKSSPATATTLQGVMYTAELASSGGNFTVSGHAGDGATVTHSNSTFADNGVVRVFCAHFQELTVRSIRWTEAA